MSTREPPRYVPTLTEVVTPAPSATAQAAPGAAFADEEQLVHRIMQRVDLTLDRRLREAVATVVIEQTKLLTPLLRQEIEEVVRQTVSQALSEELSGSGGAATTAPSAP